MIHDKKQQVQPEKAAGAAAMTPQGAMAKDAKNAGSYAKGREIVSPDAKTQKRNEDANRFKMHGKVHEKADTAGMKLDLKSGHGLGGLDTGLGGDQKGEDEGGEVKGALGKSGDGKGKFGKKGLNLSKQKVKGKWGGSFEGERWNSKSGDGGGMAKGRNGGQAGVSEGDEDAASAADKEAEEKLAAEDAAASKDEIDHNDNGGFDSTEEFAAWAAGMAKEEDQLRENGLQNRHEKYDAYSSDAGGRFGGGGGGGDGVAMPAENAEGGGKYQPIGGKLGGKNELKKAAKGPKGDDGKGDGPGAGTEKKGSTGLNGLAIEMGANKGQDAEKKKKADAGPVNFAVAMKASGWSDPKKG